MSRQERQLIKNLHDSTGKLLEANCYAEEYFCRLKVLDDLKAIDEWALEAGKK